jgi:hypothetical protein
MIRRPMILKRSLTESEEEDLDSESEAGGSDAGTGDESEDDMGAQDDTIALVEWQALKAAETGLCDAPCALPVRCPLEWRGDGKGPPAL